MPLFPSPGTGNGQISSDAGWFFGGPEDLSDCDDVFPDEDNPLGISLDGGTNWDGIDPDDRGAAPNPSHIYHLTVVGQGEPVLFGTDDEKTVDNYGIVKFTVELVPDLVWGDVNCDGVVDVLDALYWLSDNAGIVNTPDGCPAINEDIEAANFGTLRWGNLNCSPGLDTGDVTLLFHDAASLPPPNLPDCPALGVAIELENA
jgi:hypothetical protein